MKVMMTGGTTALGMAITDALLALPATEVVLAIGREQHTTWRADPRLVYRAADLTRPRVLHDLLWGEARERGIDVVIHGMQHRPASGHGRSVHAQNVDATRELLRTCADHPTVKRVVYRSFAEVYARTDASSNLIDEDEPLDFSPAAPQWVRDRVEADLTVCAHFGGTLQLAVLRCADLLAPGAGSQLWDYLQSHVCLRPLGFDPMINVLSLDDAAAAFVAAAQSSGTGVFNIPGADTLPLSRAIVEGRRADIPVPGPLMTPLYRLRRKLAGFQFDYAINMHRFHFGGVLDGSRAARELAYTPHTPVRWPRSRWQLLLERLGESQRAA